MAIGLAPMGPIARNERLSCMGHGPLGIIGTLRPIAALFRSSLFGPRSVWFLQGPVLDDLSWPRILQIKHRVPPTAMYSASMETLQTNLKCAVRMRSGNAQWKCAVEMCNGNVQWKCAMEMCSGNVQWKCAVEMCSGKLQLQFSIAHLHCIFANVYFCMCSYTFALHICTAHLHLQLHLSIAHFAMHISSAHLHCTFALHISIAHFHCTFTLHMSIAHLHCTLALSVFICPWGTMYYNNTPTYWDVGEGIKKIVPYPPKPEAPKSLQKKSRSKTKEDTTNYRLSDL